MHLANISNMKLEQFSTYNYNLFIIVLVSFSTKTLSMPSPASGLSPKRPSADSPWPVLCSHLRRHRRRHVLVLLQQRVGCGRRLRLWPAASSVGCAAGRPRASPASPAPGAGRRRPQSASWPTTGLAAAGAAPWLLLLLLLRLPRD